MRDVSNVSFLISSVYLIFVIDVLRALYLFKPHGQHINYPYLSPYITYDTYWEKLLNDQANPSWGIIILIRFTSLLNNALILQG